MVPVLYLARHATPVWDSGMVYYLPPGPQLATRGQAEARALGHFLAAAGIDRVYTSPMRRCLQTAETVGQVAGVSVEVFPALMEKQPEEDLEALHRRLWPVVERAWQEVRNGIAPSIALLTHGGPIAALLLSMGMPEPHLKQLLMFDNRNPVPPAGAWKASRKDGQAHWTLRLVFKPRASIAR